MNSEVRFNKCRMTLWLGILGLTLEVRHSSLGIMNSEIVWQALEVINFVHVLLALEVRQCKY